MIILEKMLLCPFYISSSALFTLLTWCLHGTILFLFLHMLVYHSRPSWMSTITSCDICKEKLTGIWEGCHSFTQSSCSKKAISLLNKFVFYFISPSFYMEQWILKPFFHYCRWINSLFDYTFVDYLLSKYDKAFN